MKNHFSKILILILIICFSSCRQSTENKADESAQATKSNEELRTAPNFSLESIDGNIISLKDMKGKYVVIHIAATWCPFCNAEAPYLEELYNNYKDKNVAVLLIDVKESRELVKEKLQDKFNFTFPVLLDIDGKVAASFAPEGVLPDLARDEVMLASNLLIDTNGKIQFMSLLDSKNFDAKLIALKKKLDELL